MIIFRLVKLFALALLLVVGFELVERARGHQELPFDPLDRADHLSANQRHAEARLLANFVVANPRLGDTERAQAIIERESAELDSAVGKLRRFARGAATGEPTDVASLAGSLSLDFFVIGDIRDLVVQGYKEIRYDDGDTLILALSAVGLATTLAPEIDWAPSMLKSFRRTGALNPRLARSLKRISEQAIESRSFSKLANATEDFAVAARKMGPGPLSAAVRSVDDVGDLARLRHAANVDFRSTYVVTTGFGNAGVKRIAKDGSNIAKLAGKVRRSSRFIKALRKSVGIVPTVILVLVFVLIAGLLLRGSLVKLISHRRHVPPAG